MPSISKGGGKGHCGAMTVPRAAIGAEEKRQSQGDATSRLRSRRYLVDSQQSALGWELQQPQH